MQDRREIALSGAVVVAGGKPHETIAYAAAELARFLGRLGGRRCAVKAALPAAGTAVVLDPAAAARLGVRAEAAELGEQGYRIAIANRGKSRCVVIAAAKPVGVLYGAYALLEELGMGFYAGGETYPERPAPLRLPADFERTGRPAFAMRGNMLHYNFLCGPTAWGLEDYKFYFDQLARMRCNVLLMHWYDGEPGAAYEVGGEYLAGGVTPNSLTKPWGALAALRASQFSFNTGRWFDAEIWSTPMGEGLPDLLTEIKDSEAMWCEATRYARAAGIHVAAGFEEPTGDPTDPVVMARFEARVRQFVERNPHMTHFALWQHESGACYGASVPEAGTPAAALMEEKRPLFAHLGCDTRIWQAVRYGRFAERAVALVKTLAPHLRVVVVGWGGDRWMRFSDLCLGFDRWLPPDVIFTCHDNIDASFGPNVSSGWGQLPATRERWAMPWVEGDIDECWVRQPHVESLGKLAPDALAKGCQGLLTLQWRTRDVEEETGYIAQYAWDPTLTPERFYRRLARNAFGADHEADMGRMLGDLQRQGARWTGVRGSVECGVMRWTGWTPPFPADCDEAAVRFLMARAGEALDALATAPAAGDTGGAFHEREGDAGTGATRDLSRFGCREMQAALEGLTKLLAERDEARRRAGLAAVEEGLWALRTPLIERGMTGPVFRTFDGLMIALHHVQRNAGASWKLPKVAALRAELARLRKRYAAAGRVERLERLDYLAATMDFVLGYDRTALRLVEGGHAERTLAAAEEAKKAGDVPRAAALAAEAYAEVVAAGLRASVEAYTNKLTTRCDFGTLATINVKALPLFWDTLGKLEALMPAAPPREVTARGQAKEVRLSWDAAARATGLNLYRRKAGGAWALVNATGPLAGPCRLFVDRGVRPGEWEYAVSALGPDGWESPKSQPARAACGPVLGGPRIVASKPAARMSAGEPLAVKAVVAADRGVRSATLCWRQDGERAWKRVPMVHRFRESYGVVVSAGEIRRGLVEFKVEAVDADGRKAVWPEAATVGLPWSVAVM